MLAEIPLMLFLVDKRIAVIGAGSIGEQVIKALYEKGHHNIIATRSSKEALEVLAQRYNGIETTTNNRDAARQAHMIILAAKPKGIEEVAKEIREETKEKLVISIAAAKSLDYLYTVLDPQARIARVMTGLYVRDELAAYCFGHNASAEDRAMVRYIFGRNAIELEEKLLAHRTFIACYLGLLAKQIDVQIEQLEEEGLPRKEAHLFYAAMLDALAQQVKNGISGNSIYEEVGGPESFTKRLGTMIEKSGFYQLLQKCVEETVRACGGK